MTPLVRDVRQAVLESCIHAAGRSQLVGAAIDVIAELGVADASVVKIAKYAGVSRGVVAYHFRDIEDLVDAVVAEVYRLGGERLRQRVASAATPRDSLLTFIAGSVESWSAGGSALATPRPSTAVSWTTSPHCSRPVRSRVNSGSSTLR